MIGFSSLQMIKILDISDFMDRSVKPFKHKTKDDRQTLESFKAFYALVADGTDYQYAERLKQLSFKPLFRFQQQ